MPFYIISGLIGLVVIAVSCGLFTNSIEWAAIRFKLNRGDAGQILAAAGSAIPEIIIPIIAVIFIPGERGQEISTGAILGVPFMMSTLVFGITGIAALVYSAVDKRALDFSINEKPFSNDLIFFSAVFTAAIIFSFFPVGVKKALGFLFLAAYAAYVFRMNKKYSFKDEFKDGQAHGLYFSKKKIPEGKLVLLQAAVSVFGMAAGAKFLTEGIKYAASVVNIKAFILALLIAPLATELPKILDSLICLKKNKEMTALLRISHSMVFQGSLVIFTGIAVTDWILSPQARLSAAVAAASALVTVAVLKVSKKINAYMLLPGAGFYVLYLILVIKWVK